MRPFAAAVAAALLAVACTGSSDPDPDIDALVEERVEAALAERTSTVADEPVVSDSAVDLMVECTAMFEKHTDYTNDLTMLAVEGTAAIEALDLPEFRRIYRASLAAFDDLMAYDARVVDRCEDVSLSTAQTAAAWREGRDAHASLVSSHEGLRDTCREMHEFFDMDRSDC